MKYRFEELAGMIDHSLLHPTLTDRELEEGADWRSGTESLRSVSSRMRSGWRRSCCGGGVRVGAVVGFSARKRVYGVEAVRDAGLPVRTGRSRSTW